MCSCLLQPAKSQEPNPIIEQQLENFTDLNDGETEDDSYLQLLLHYQKHPLNLNTASVVELQELRMLNALQLQHFLRYRQLLGNFISIYELQAIPAWNIETIKRILPYVTVATAVNVKAVVKQQLTNGEYSVLARISTVLEKAKGYTQINGSHYEGNRLHYLLRYRYRFKNDISYGITADKDPGEPFFRGVRKNGFDFYSFHFFAANHGHLKALAIGDYAVNLGQGLIQWQSLAFKKSADVMNIKRQAATIRPYTSAGEYFFNRGVAATVQTGRWELTGFFSLKKNSASYDTDSAGAKVVTSILTNGYHRTLTEINKRNKLVHYSAGERVAFKANKWLLAFNSVMHHFETPLLKRDEPYNAFSIRGNDWFNYSVDYSYTKNNIHFFGEAAADKKWNKATINGLLVSINPLVDVSLLHRNISMAYQAVDGNAFTENNLPTNENGIYLGSSIRPIPTFRIDAYADVFQFPWLKYLVDAPSKGKEFLLQLSYSPDKLTEIYSRFKSEAKEGNHAGNNTVLNYTEYTTKQNWRTQIQFRLNRLLQIRSRLELVWVKTAGEPPEQGFLAFIDGVYASPSGKWGANCRLAYFETGSYASRIYTYENDVLYGYSIPAFAGKGYRAYMNFQYNVSAHIKIWLKFSQSIYKDEQTVGSGLDEINGNKKTEGKFQLIWMM